MRRRAVLLVVLGLLGVLAAPLDAPAQPAAARPRVGVLLTGSPTDKAQTRELDAFTRKLGELGLVDGQTLTVTARWANTPDRFPALAAELVRTVIE